MKKILMAIVVAGGVCAAETIETTDGKTYERAEVIETGERSITIMHSGGVSRIPHTRLPEDIRNKYGLDENSIQERRQEKEDKRREQRRAERKRKRQLKEQINAGRPPFYSEWREILQEIEWSEVRDIMGPPDMTFRESDRLLYWDKVFCLTTEKPQTLVIDTYYHSDRQETRVKSIRVTTTGSEWTVELTPEEKERLKRTERGLDQETIKLRRNWYEQQGNPYHY